MNPSYASLLKVGLSMTGLPCCPVAFAGYLSRQKNSNVTYINILRRKDPVLQQASYSMHALRLATTSRLINRWIADRLFSMPTIWLPGNGSEIIFAAY
jgi:hypothetical protein